MTEELYLTKARNEKRIRVLAALNKFRVKENRQRNAEARRGLAMLTHACGSCVVRINADILLNLLAGVSRYGIQPAPWRQPTHASPERKGKRAASVCESCKARSSCKGTGVPGKSTP